MYFEKAPDERGVYTAQTRGRGLNMTSFFYLCGGGFVFKKKEKKEGKKNTG